MSALTVARVAERWQTSEAQVYQLIKSGSLKSFKIGTRGIRVSESELQRWESGENSGATNGTVSRSNGEKKYPLPAGAMKALMAGGGG